MNFLLHLAINKKKFDIFARVAEVLVNNDLEFKPLYYRNTESKKNQLSP